MRLFRSTRRIYLSQDDGIYPTNLGNLIAAC
jgi:hypothetical protein